MWANGISQLHTSLARTSSSHTAGLNLPRTERTRTLLQGEVVSHNYSTASNSRWHALALKCGRRCSSGRLNETNQLTRRSSICAGSRLNSSGNKKHHNFDKVYWYLITIGCFTKQNNGTEKSDEWTFEMYDIWMWSIQTNMVSFCFF